MASFSVAKNGWQLVFVASVLFLGCLPLGINDWVWAPSDPLSYIDSVYTQGGVPDVLRYRLEGVAAERAETPEQSIIWGIGNYLPLFAGEEYGPHILGRYEELIYIQPSDSNAVVVFVIHVVTEQPWWTVQEDYEVYCATNVALEWDGGLVRGTFRARGKKYERSAGSFVSSAQDDVSYEQEIQFQLKLDPPPENANDLIGRAKTGFGTLVEQVLQENQAM